MAAKRERRRPEEARRLILDAAESLLCEGGVQAVQVRAVARAVGMTDAGVSHHFGGREQLLEALLRHGGRRLKAALGEVVAGSLDHETDVGVIVRTLADVYRQGYAELALALHMAGWRDDSVGLLDEVVDVLRARSNGRRTRDDIRLAVAALHQSVALDSTFGAAFRRSAGIAPDAAKDQRDQIEWWVGTLRDMIEAPS